MTDTNGSCRVGAADATRPLILSIDVGSSSGRALVYDAHGRVVDGWEVHRPYAPETTRDGGVVAAPDALLELVTGCIESILTTMGNGQHDIAAIAFDTFWHSLVGVDPHNRAVTPVYTWADTRSGTAAAELRKRMNESLVHARTGCVLHSSYLPAKLLWLHQSQPELVDRVRYWMSFGEYMYLRLFGERRVSVSMASGSGLLDQHTCQWDGEVLDAVGVRQDQLSPLADFADTMTGLAEPFRTRWPALGAVPWYLPLGDGACNNIGSGGIDDDRVVVMIGTSGALRVVRTAEEVRIPTGLWSYRIDRYRIIQGGAFSDGGNVFAWMANNLRVQPVANLEHEVAAMQPDSHGLTILPFLAGERSPDWNVNARAAVVGMRLDTKAVDIVRAALEAIAFRFSAVYEILNAVIPRKRSMIGSGVALVSSPAWRQIMSDALGEPMVISTVPEATSRGAALLVLQSMGVTPDLSAVSAPVSEPYEPNPEHTRIYRAAMKRQQQLYDLMLGVPGHLHTSVGHPPRK